MERIPRWQNHEIHTKHDACEHPRKVRAGRKERISLDFFSMKYFTPERPATVKSGIANSSGQRAKFALICG